MIVYFKWVLRRQLFSLLVLTATVYMTMSTFGITSEVAQSSSDSSDQATSAGDDSNPYSAIIKANVFHLTDPPKPAEKPDQALVNLPKVNISGFIRHADQPVRALFATVPKDPKELPRYFNLSEGEKEDILQVTKIYPNEDAVDVIIAGTAVTLTTKSNSFVQPLPPPPKGGVSPGAASSPAAVAYRSPTPQPTTPSQAAYSGNVIVAGGGSVPAAGGSTVTTIGSSPGSTGVSADANSPASNPGYGGPSYASASGVSGSPGMSPVPTRSLPPNFPAPYQPRTPQESAALIAVDSQLHQNEIQSGRYPPPPPLPSIPK